MVENNCKNPLCIDGKIYIPLENGKISEDNFKECPDCRSESDSDDFMKAAHDWNNGFIDDAMFYSECITLYQKAQAEIDNLRECNKILAEVNLNNAGKISELKNKIAKIEKEHPIW